MKYAWYAAEPFLFTSIGAVVTVDKLDKSHIGYGAIIVIIALLVKMLTNFILAAGYGWTVMERVFMSTCHIPKAATQATLAGVILTAALKL